MMFKQAVTSEQLKSRFPAIFAEQEKQSLSDKYLYIPTYKIVEGLEKQGFSIVGAKQSGARTTEARQHAKHVVYMSHKTIDQAWMNVGEEMPMLALTNSHNGLSSFAVDTAFFRLACSNGLLMPTTALNSSRIVHKIGMEREVIEAASAVVTSFPEQVAMIESMKSIQLSDDERMAFAESARNLIFSEETIEVNTKAGIDLSAKLLLTRRREDTERKSGLWGTFNAIQENAIKGGLRIVTQGESGRRTLTRTRPVNAIDRDSKLNKELMALAIKMAELKDA